jgi:hypothetical protein
MDSLLTRAPRIAITLALLLAASCSDAPSAATPDAGVERGPRVTMQWRLRCETVGGCADFVDRSVDAVDDEADFDITCRVEETATTRLLTFSAQHRSGYGFVLNRALFPRAGGAPMGSGAAVLVQEPAENYLAVCGAEPPSAEQQCQATARFTRDLEGRPSIEGEIFCVGAASTIGGGGASPIREVTAPGESATAAMTPLHFALRDCEGYVPD